MGGLLCSFPALLEQLWVIHGSESFLFVVGSVQPLRSSCVKQDFLSVLGTVSITADHVLQHFCYFKVATICYNV